MQINKVIFQKDKSSDNQNHPEIQEYFEQNDLKAQLQAKDTVISKLKEIILSLRENANPAKVKKYIDEIETINIELEHRVAKLLFENEKLHKEKEHLKKTYKELYDSIKPSCVHAKEQCDSLIVNLNSKSMENVDLKAQIQEKVFANAALKSELRKLKGKTVIDTVVSKPHATTIAPGMFKLDLVPLAPKVLKNKDANLKYIKHSREHVDTLREIVESARALSPLDSNLDSTCKSNRFYWASGSKPTGNTKNNMISQSSSNNKTNKVEDQSRSIKSRKNKKNRVALTECNAYVMQSMLNANSKSVCAICNECLFVANHDKCVLDYVNDVNVLSKSKPVKCKNKKQIWKPIVVQIVLWYLDSGCSKHMIRNCSQLTNLVKKFLGTVKFGNDNIAKIMGYGDYQIGNVTISKVYYIEGLRHNLLSVGQICDSDLEVAFRKHTCFVRNLKGVDLLTGSRGTNLYTLSIGDMMKSSPICLLSKASKTKYWLWHRLIVDDYYRFTWVKFLRSKDEAPEFIINGRKFAQIIEENLSIKLCVAIMKMSAEAVATTCYTQNRSLIRLCHEKTPYELLHDRKPDLSYLHVFGVLCYPTNDNEDLGKLKAKADFGIFIGYAPTKKAYRIYNRRTRQIVETIHANFDELITMASEQSSLGPAFNEMTPETLIPKVAAPVPIVSTGASSLILVDQDAPSPSTSQTQQESSSHVIPPGVEEADHDIEVAHVDNNPQFGIPILEPSSEESSS
ncbi:retrovirus-related pol polyprotein from transposon TNT 1-94 [Tanacetum coccineum]|uniref:Retrovirus-related pol polyprotein from transposon TNT 1-94 n=1 Tax=Tanacetum coccineum TaxID=301880 RepID=A0ABQ5CMC5_9ASTR